MSSTEDTDVANRDDRSGPVWSVRAATLRTVLVLLVLGWTYVYNLTLKELGPLVSFFEILDTISDDFVMGTLFTVGVGLAIVFVFSATKLYTQIIANVYSFRIIEDLVHGELRAGRYREFFSKLFHFEDLPEPESCCPRRVSSLLYSFSFLYVMSWIYVVLFSEALFFVSWSAGVDLPLNSQNLLLLPTLALSIPFSARVMAYLRYPYAQDYADFMPGAVFALLVVTALGSLFESDDQVFFLLRVYNNHGFRMSFLRNGAFLAFIPVFFEAGFWLLELGKAEARERNERA
jgi:hypothetical protein